MAASTHNQAFAAILFLYEKVLQIELPNIHAVRARQPEWLPVVLAVGQMRQLLAPQSSVSADADGCPVQPHPQEFLRTARPGREAENAGHRCLHEKAVRLAYGVLENPTPFDLKSRSKSVA